jgi:protein-S-isoprenylcysteine O-methyltransferase Ste14
MNRDVALLVLLNFATIGLLPKLFFRRGEFNARWMLTASPYAGASAFVILAATGVLPPWFGHRSDLAGVAVVASAASLSLIWLTVGTHRIPLALWHQTDDAPQEIVTWGPYSRIRHPFYTSFVLALLAGALVAPGWGTLGMLLMGVFALALTARREERRLLSSSLGNVYRDYMRSTGRFLPALGRLQ